MDAVFINSLPGGEGINRATLEPPLGIAYLASMLEKHGYSCALIDADILRLETENVLHRVPTDTRLIGLYLNSFNYTAVLTTCRTLRQERQGSVVILGGPLASAAPQMVLSEIPCHGLVRGEGEYAVIKIMENMNSGSPPFGPNVMGAAYHSPDTADLIMNPVERISNLDELPFPSFHLLPPLSSYRSRARKKPVGTIVTSRGCAYECIFCSKDIFQRRVVFRSASNVLNEVDYLVKRHGIRQLDILDDNFAAKKSHMESILDGLIERHYDLAINLQPGIRPEFVDESLLRKMKTAGVFKLAFGIESADPEVLKICRKKLDLDKTKEAARLARKQGLVVSGYFIIGLPGETDESFRRTLEFAREAGFDVCNFAMAIPFVGTELYRMVEQSGKFLVDTTRNIDVGFFAGTPFYELGNIRAEDVARRYWAAYREFYSIRRQIKMLSQIRSRHELLWQIGAGLEIVKVMLKRKKR